MEEISIIVNGKSIPLTEFPRSIIIKTILGMLEALKDVEDPRTVEIKIKLS